VNVQQRKILLRKVPAEVRNKLHSSEGDEKGREKEKVGTGKKSGVEIKESLMANQG